uniref:Uncharacterized protein n=1 Tax=Glossina palpalis gambiensis TaxID=67801 RepID=A0A1B0BF75_9MUSC
MNDVLYKCWIYPENRGGHPAIPMVLEPNFLWLTGIPNDFYLLSPRKCMVIKVPVNITAFNVVVVGLVSLGAAYNATQRYLDC